ncbi:VWA domain-containing protein [Sabulicella glaciei]|uniref:VWA domain-containing protein n=1 Tax=Sabulicella glaciei TaxID=2984948 RepID=A0ABT3NPP0_9PROT|nr:VWA domain-containing protein [Roseococcus sp. MDT2-1-1]MCW8084132.1 VWA domain-containing protein [Roseococcus sp. MDT2-1-1]
MAQLPAPKSGGAVAEFLRRLDTLPAVRPTGRGRLLFAVDATASRQPSWDRACHVQAEMFVAAEGLGGLAVQLCYWRGHREFAATPFLTDASELARRMSGVSVLAGQTQIHRCLEHALRETTAERVHALVLVGDALEEAIDPIGHLAAQLGLRGTPVFCFQEGGDQQVEWAFRQIAKLSGGAWAPFDSASPDALRDLLRAVAVFAAGGRSALAKLPGRAASGIAGQLPAPRRG